MNAAVWLGTAIFFTFGAEPACFSTDMRAALQLPAGQSYFPGAISGVVMGHYYGLMMACAVVALLHFLAEWVYLGRPRRKFSFGLVAALFVLTLIGSRAVEPSLVHFNSKHYRAAQPAERESAGKNFRILRVTGIALNVLIIGGLVVYVSRVSSPSDTLRFMRPVQFRG
jgi:succinate dehydrogenase hydrophobic anchor subunit